MAISYVSGASGTTTATLGSHQAGDLILVFAYRDGSITAPTLPADFTNISTASGNTNSARVGFKIATSNAESVSTWTNATTTIAVVYRGVQAIGGSNNTNGSSNIVIYPAITMTQTDGSSWVVGFAGHRSTNVTLEVAPPGMTNRISALDATDEAAGHDTDGGVTSWSSKFVSVGGTVSGWASIVVELVAATALTNALFWAFP